MRLSVVLVGCLVVTMALSGCFGPSVPTEKFHESAPATASTIFSLQNNRGSVTVTVWDEPTIDVSAVKTAVNQSELAKGQIYVVKAENSVSVETWYTGHGKVAPTIVYTVKVPRNVTVSSVTTYNGAVVVQGVKGNVSVGSSNGSVTLSDIGGYVSAYTTNGAVSLAFGSDVKALLDVSTTNGQITTPGFTLGNVTSDQNYLTGQLNGGTLRFVVSTTNGDVTLGKYSG